MHQRHRAFFAYSKLACPRKRGDANAVISGYNMTSSVIGSISRDT